MSTPASFAETDLTDRLAIVTGGGSGIGRATARLLALHGADVVLAARKADRTGVPGGAAYSAAKAGLQMFTKVIAAEWGPSGVRANAIAVGAVASEGALRAWSRFGMSADDMGKRNPLRRVGQPSDIANGVLYFASDLSSWVTGQTLSIDGGPPLQSTVD
jgi:NAD(P)-dependent dehydrogenase (short-subunit alcohol dehydrogenase family)